MILYYFCCIFFTKTRDVFRILRRAFSLSEILRMKPFDCFIQNRAKFTQMQLLRHQREAHEASKLREEFMDSQVIYKKVVLIF